MEEVKLCKDLSDSLSVVQSSMDQIRSAQTEIEDLFEQISTVEKLPDHFEMCQISRFKPKLVAKIMSKITDLEAEIQQLLRDNLSSKLNFLREHSQFCSSLSYTSSQDLEAALSLFQESISTLSNDLKSRKFNYTVDFDTQQAINHQLDCPQYNLYKMDEPPPEVVRRNKDFVTNHINEADIRRCSPAGKAILGTLYANQELGTEAIADYFPYDIEFIKRLLFNKHILIVGDSLSRGIYKDLVYMLAENTDRILEDKFLKSNVHTDISHFGDRQIDVLSLANDRVFRQSREFQTECNLIQLHFTTRVFKLDMEHMFGTMLRNNEFPDLIVMNSALWDLTRYNQHKCDMRNVRWEDDCPLNQRKNEIFNMEEYLERLGMLLRRVRSVCPSTTKFVWVCMPWPLPPEVDNGKSFLNRAGSEDKKDLQRSLYLDGNSRAAQVVRNAGYDVLDLSFYMRNHSLYGLRKADGVHWNAVGVRFMTQLLIGHLARGVDVPKHIKERISGWMKTFEKPDISSGENKRLGEGSAYDLLKTYSKRGHHAEELQKKIRSEVLENLSKDLKKALLGDIAVMRMVNFIRSNRIHLSREQVDELEQIIGKKSKVLETMGMTSVERVRFAKRNAE